MGLDDVTFDDFRRALGWASSHGRRMLIREIRYRAGSYGRREPLIGEWYSLSYSSGKLSWTDPTVSPFLMDHERIVTLSRTMRFRLDLMDGKAEVRDGRGLYLQVRIEVPDQL